MLYKFTINKSSNTLKVAYLGIHKILSLISDSTNQDFNSAEVETYKKNPDNQ